MILYSKLFAGQRQSVSKHVAIGHHSKMLAIVVWNILSIDLAGGNNLCLHTLMSSKCTNTGTSKYEH